MNKIITTFIVSLIILNLHAQEFVDDAQVSQIENDTESEFILAMKDVALDKNEEAIDKFKKLVRKSPDDGICEYQIAKIYFKQSDYANAQIYAKKATDKQATNIYYKELLIEIFNKNKDFKSAADLMRSIISEHKFDRKEYFELADMYVKAKDINSAVSVLDELEKLTGTDIQIEFQKISYLLREQDYTNAMKLAEKLEKNNQNNVEVLLKKAMISRLQGDEKMTDATYDKIKKLDPQNPQVLSYYTSKKNTNQNESNYFKNLQPFLQNQDISLDEKILTLAPNVANISKNSESANDLTKVVKTVVDMYPNSAKSNSLYADLLYNTDRIEESLEYYKLSLKYDKSNFTIWKQILLIYNEKEDWKNLEKLCSEAVDFYPNHSVLYFYWGKSFINLGNFAKAHEQLEESLALIQDNPKFKNEILMMKANAFIREKKTKEANSVLESLDDNTKNNHPFYFELMGDIESLNSNNAKASEYWKTSIDKGNNSKSIMLKYNK